ncbi:MAG: Gfo/Idh/MocA family protein [Aestuariivirga sp.]
MTKPRILILGTGGMATQHVRHFRDDPRCEIVAACDVIPGRAEEFAKQHGIKHHFTKLEDAIASGAFDVASNVTPDPIHHPTTMKLLAANKHVLCEKPLAENYPLAKEMADAAEKAGLINMVNLTYRNAAALSEMQKRIAAGEIGDVRHVEASYRQSWLTGNSWGDWRTDPKWLWRLSGKHGSKGVLGDVGVHILDFTAFAIGMLPAKLHCRLKTFDKAPGNKIGEYTLDANDSALISVEFPNGALGVIHASRFMTGYDNVLKLQVFGTEGAIEIHHGSGWTELRLCNGPDIHNLAWRQLASAPVETNHRRFITAILTGKNAEPSFRRGAELQRFLDMCAEPEAR